MAKRHEFRPGDWESVAMRLDEIISAHSGEDPFEEALKLLVAKLAFESDVTATKPFLDDCSEEAAARAVDHLLAAASERWSGILDPGSATKLSGPELLRCAQVLNSVRLFADDLVGLDAIFEFIVSKASKGQKGQYFTPRHVIAEVVEMIQPQPGERIIDPACGSGGFLRHALMKTPSCSVWGFDNDPRAVRVARVMMAASNQSAAQVMRTDSLRRPDRKVFSEPLPVIEDLVRAQDSKFRAFDIVLTNPPFAGDVGNQYSESYQLAHGRRVERDVLFVERCIELLRAGGRFAIVLPHNKVGADSFSFVREWLLKHTRIVAVLGLGRNTFLPHTSQKACVVIGYKRKKPALIDRDEEILFFISERDGKDHKGKLVYSSEEDVIDHDLPEATALVQKQLGQYAEGRS